MLGSLFACGVRTADQSVQHMTFNVSVVTMSTRSYAVNEWQAVSSRTPFYATTYVMVVMSFFN